MILCRQTKIDYLPSFGSYSLKALSVSVKLLQHSKGLILLSQFIFRVSSSYLSIIFPNVTIPCDVKPLVTMAVQLTAFIKVLLAKVAVIIMNRLLIKCDVKNHYLSKYYSVFIWFECLMSFIISSLNKSFVCLNSWLLSSSHEHLKSNYNSSLQPESNTFQHPQVLICKKGFIVCYAENSKFEFDKTWYFLTPHKGCHQRKGNLYM